MIKKLDDLLEVKYDDRMVLSVVQAQDSETLMAVLEAEELGLIEPILIGNKEEIENILVKFNKNVEEYNIINELDFPKSAEIGVSLVREGKADFVMKGLVESSTILKAVLNKEKGIRSGKLLSHLMAYEIEAYPKLLFLTDGGMNIAPNVEQKAFIIENAIQALKALGNKNIKVACLAAKEVVDEKMPATVDANELKNIFKDNLDAKVDGPMALDLAISKESKKIKKYESDVAGDADILLVPNIEMGNGIGKSITYFAKGKAAGIIMGAKAPIILTSRADSHMNKLYSIALGGLIAKNI